MKVKESESEVTQSCLTVCDPWTIAHGSSVHGILQARILKWVAIPFSRGSSRPRDQNTYVNKIPETICIHTCVFVCVYVCVVVYVNYIQDFVCNPLL